jgi:phytoene dehydrogenase-like protein
MNRPDVIIVGGGLAGLACALEVESRGGTPLILEGDDRPGGRVRTDEVQGFRLDRGFQVYLDSYPAGRALLDYEALDLRRFTPGALVQTSSGLTRIADPWRQPSTAMQTLASPVGSLSDKLKVAGLRSRVRGGDPAELLEGPDRSTLQDLREQGFSSGFIDAFFRPFYGGVFLDRSLETSSRLFRYTFRMFAEGGAGVPALGMEEIPRQMAARLSPGVLRTHSRVQSIQGSAVTLESGERLEGDSVVVAADPTGAARLLGTPPPPMRASLCLYFSADEPPVAEATLVLNGTDEGPVNNLAVMSQVSSGYAPAGRELIAVVVVPEPNRQQGQNEPGAMEAQVRRQLEAWFGSKVRDWDFLRSYWIPESLPAQGAGSLTPASRTARRSDGIILAGDHMETASIQGALQSGRIAAQLALEGGS